MVSESSLVMNEEEYLDSRLENSKNLVEQFGMPPLGVGWGEWKHSIMLDLKEEYRENLRKLDFLEL